MKVADPLRLLCMAAGAVAAIYLGGGVFPALAKSVGPMGFAGLTAGVGGALGAIAYQVFRHIKPN